MNLRTAIAHVWNLGNLPEAAACAGPGAGASVLCAVMRLGAFPSRLPSPCDARNPYNPHVDVPGNNP